MQLQTRPVLRMPQQRTCPVSRWVSVLLVSGEVGIELLAEVVRGLRRAGDWLPPTLIVKLLASRIRLNSNACGLTTSTFRVSEEGSLSRTSMKEACRHLQ